MESRRVRKGRPVVGRRRPQRVLLMLPLIALVAGFALAAAITGCRVSPASQASAGPAEGTLTLSGIIEATEYAIAPEVGGRVVEVAVEEGRTVRAGDLLLRLDDSLLTAQRNQAEAALAAAQASYRVVSSPVRPEELRAAQAAQAQAQAAYDGAVRSLALAQKAYDQALPLKQAVDAAQAQYDLAKAQLDGIQPQLDQIASMRDSAKTTLDNLKDLAARNLATQAQVTEAQKAYDELQAKYLALDAARKQAEAALTGADRALATANQAYSDKTQLEQQLVAAQSQADQAKAALDAATAKVELLKKGARTEEKDAARAQVAQAQAALDLIETQLAKTRLESPVSGLVTGVNLRPGELAAPGSTAVTLTDLKALSVRVYVPETDLNRVHIGAKVKISVDAYPGRTFEGTVADLASQAEFTPKNVQTRKERSNLVFAVRIDVSDPSGSLKPGLPADVEFEP